MLTSSPDHTAACDRRMMETGDHTCTCPPDAGANTRVPVYGTVETMGGESFAWSSFQPYFGKGRISC